MLPLLHLSVTRTKTIDEVAARQSISAVPEVKLYCSLRGHISRKGVSQLLICPWVKGRKMILRSLQSDLIDPQGKSSKPYLQLS